MLNESNTCYALVISGVGRGVEWEGGAGGCSLRSQNVLWLDVEEETTASDDSIGCSFKLIRGHTFMTATKNGQFCASLLHLSK